MRIFNKKQIRKLSVFFVLLLFVFIVSWVIQKQEEPNTGNETGTNHIQEQPENLVVQFLDVGQGSATLIRQNDSWMLIDGGDRDYSSYVVSYLQKQGVEKLDYVIATHYDADHLNGLVGVLTVFECEQVIGPDYETDTRVYKSFCSIIEEKEIPMTYPKVGDSFTFADSSFEILGPATYYEDANSNSLCIRIEYKENSFLISGDCTEEAEQDILYTRVDLDSDVFAANHHGSKYSNTEEFLDAVSPDAIVVSCGVDNSYGHPHAKAMLNIQKQGADMYRTDLQGVITAVADGTTIAFENEVCMDYRNGNEIADDPTIQKPLPEGEKVDTKEEFVLNTGTKKFHRPDCGSVEDIREENKETTEMSRKELEKLGYEPCKRCEP